MKCTKHGFWLLLFCISLVFKSYAANRFWIAAAASNWNNSANWSNVSGGAGGFSIPGLGDAATFNNLGQGNCTFDIAITLQNITVVAGYTGTISQGTNSLTVGNNASFSGGFFGGGSANITIGGNFTLNGTVFTSTSAVLEFDGNSAFNTATFIHNNGTVRYNGSGATTISGLSPILNILEFVGEGFNYSITSSGDITVLTSLNLSGSLSYNLNTGIIDVNGNINVTNTAAGCSGSTLININGTGIQNFNGASSAGQGALPQLTINKTSGSLNLFNFPASSNTFTYTAGLINPGTSTYCFVDGTAVTYTISGSPSLNNIVFLAITNATFNLAAATTLTATGDFTMAGTNRITINTGNISVSGNIFLTNTSTTGGGSASIKIIGTGNETMDGTAIAISQNLLPFLTINKPSGTLILKGNISISQDWTYTSGIVDASSFASTVIFGGNALNITSSGMSFYNVKVTANTISLLNNLTLNNNLSISGGHLSPGTNTINISGNWNDFGATGFTEGTGTVNFNGSSLQTILTAGGENFNNLTINNSGTGIQLENNISVETVLTMTQGNIDLNSNTLTLGTGAGAGNIGTLAYSTGTLINTGSLTRWFAKATIAAGSSAGLFPVGNINNYQPFYISAPTAPTTGGTVSLSYVYVNGNSNVSFADGASTVTVIKNLNWTLSTGNGLAGGTYNLDAQGTGLGTIGNVADLRVTLINGVVGTAGANAGTIVDPQVNRTGLSLANLSNSFFIGSVNFTTSDLPSILTAFTANLVDERVELQWETAIAANNDYFTIQRSTDAVSWNDLSKIQGNGSSDSISNYTAFDPSPYPGITYYRIVLTGFDGNQSFSEVKSIKIQKQFSTISSYPNPATTTLFIGSSSAESIEIILFNSSGQRMSVPVQNNGNSAILSVNNLNSGIYYLRILQKGFSETRKIIVSR